MALSRVDFGENAPALRRMRGLRTDRRLRCKIETEEQKQASCVSSRNKQASSPKKKSKPSTMEEAAVEFLLENLKKSPHDQGRFDQKRQDPGFVCSTRKGLSCVNPTYWATVGEAGSSIHQLIILDEPKPEQPEELDMDAVELDLAAIEGLKLEME
ncbi:SAUR-like auxin-responsive protein family [Striga asiatica]|uniref:SAUR-like auxin-responsive protein family n=1 Tax=Striga asiatica TaxID=4170 RepID=A0A5A7PUI5_STRAF|nr:SAUR-like auxin-responsive protein family [Striga asiatica]